MTGKIIVIQLSLMTDTLMKKSDLIANILLIYMETPGKEMHTSDGRDTNKTHTPEFTGTLLWWAGK